MFSLVTTIVEAINALVDIGVTVYVGIRYGYEFRQWSELLYPTANATAYRERMDPFVNFLRKNKISGVVLEGLSIYVSKIENFFI